MSRLIVTIQHLSTLSIHPLSLTLLPICFSVGCGLAATNSPSREPYRFGTYLVALVVLTDWIPSLSTPSVCWSLSLPFRGGHSRYGYPGDTIHHVTLFLPTYRDCTPHVPWRLWKVRDSNPRSGQILRCPLHHLRVFTFLRLVANPSPP